MKQAIGAPTLPRIARLGATVGLSAAGAVVAHAGPAGLTQGAWLAVAALGGAIAMAAALATAYVTVRLRLGARRMAHGGGGASISAGWSIDQPSFLRAAGLMLTCQFAAHLALIGAGMAPAQGEAGSIALHVAIATVTASLLWLIGTLLSRARADYDRALAAAAQRLLSHIRRRPPIPAGRRRNDRPRAGAVRGRAPPGLPCRQPRRSTSGSRCFTTTVFQRRTCESSCSDSGRRRRHGRDAGHSPGRLRTRARQSGGLAVREAAAVQPGHPH